MKTVKFALVATCLLAGVVCGKGPKYDDPKKVDADYAYQGEYVGSIQTDDGETKIGAQIIALGKGQFRAVGYHGGLPGEGWDGEEPNKTDGKLTDGKVVFKNDTATGTLADGVISITVEGRKLGSLKKVTRKSKTLGIKAPKGAVVLFSGKEAENWKNGRTKNGLLLEGTTSKRMFRDHTIHIEFRLPYQPEDRGQGRGNSGIYVQGRYEVQMLDSFGLEGKQNECGGIYSVGRPSVNMCYPPLTWQTYDIDYTAPKYKDGKLVSNPRMTVRHNGVVIHKDVELPGNRSTTAAPVKPGDNPGPVYLQNHGCPVRYRNIWVVEK